MFHVLKTIATFTRVNVSLAVTFTAVAATVICSHHVDWHTLLLACAVLLLASGSSALNQCQEWRFDAKMERTRSRPLPSGDLKLFPALMIAFGLITAGSFLLLRFSGITAALLGLFNVVWYNGFYTYLKRSTPFAVVPGSLTGAVPVLIGWTAAGGDLFNATAIYIAFFVFIWQIPHFWLLMMKYSDEYKAAGFPVIDQKLSPKAFKRIIFAWILATTASSVMVPLFLKSVPSLFLLLVVLLNVGLVLVFTRLSFGPSADTGFRRAFMSINIYMFIFMTMLVAFHLLY